MKPKKIPMTLERVGSEGKFFTDNMILLILGCVIIDAVLSVIVMAQLSYKLPTYISIVIAVIVFIIQLPWYIRKIAFKEKQLKELLKKMINFKKVNINKFHDIYDYIDDVALHNSGHTSLFVEIVRGSTLGMTNIEAEEYYKCVQNFQNRILQLGYQYKDINIETEDLSEEEDLMLKQVNGAREFSNNLSDNLRLKYKYTQAFMSKCIRKERWVYVIISEETDTTQFKARVRQMLGVLNNYHIQEVSIMKRDEIEAFALEYFDIKLFNPDVGSDELKEVLEFF